MKRYGSKEQRGLRELLWMVMLVIAISSCRDKTVDPATDTDTNNWILDQMKYWYYWNDKIIANPDLSKTPDKFFDDLLYKYDATLRPDGDRFSWIQSSAEELKASLGGESKTTGMHFKLVNYPAGSQDVIGVVFYTLPGSPAAKAGIRRGDVFSGINGQKLTTANYYGLVYGSGTITYTLASIDDNGAVIESGIKKDITPVTFQEDPVHFDTTFQYGANKVGYLVYNEFNPGPNSGPANQYDQKLETLFAKFKSSQVNSLVLDLRYNPGGYVSSATTLASLIGKVSANDIFYFKEYNSVAKADLLKKYGQEYFYSKFAAKAQNIGPQLKNLFILTSSRTASASELLINGLAPFMEVKLVGGKTVGKNVGSVTLSNEKAGIKWGLQPIVTKSFNGLHQSEYATGFIPDFPVTEGVKIYPYGDIRDPLLGEALFRIVGTRVVRQSAESQKITVKEGLELGSTIERKAGGGNMFFDH
jgi:carboxyl-terminal processing protease